MTLARWFEDRQTVGMLGGSFQKQAFSAQDSSRRNDVKACPRKVHFRW